MWSSSSNNDLDSNLLYMVSSFDSINDGAGSPQMNSIALPLLDDVFNDIINPRHLLGIVDFNFKEFSLFKLGESPLQSPFTKPIARQDFRPRLDAIKILCQDKRYFDILLTFVLPTNTQSL
ncbi:unnamed protein product [Gordionus sp. m RMFG-2023]